MSKTKQTKSKSSVYFPTGIIVSMVGALGLIAATLRMLQLLRYIDFTTGFYDGPAGLTIGLGIVLVIGFVFLLAVSLMDRHVYTIELSRKQNVLLGIVVLFAGMGLLFDFTTGILDILTKTLAPNALEIIRMVLELAAAVSLLMLAVRPDRQGQRKAVDLVHLLPCIWSVVTMVTFFLRNTVVTSLSENLYLILFMVFVTLFLLNTAKYWCGYGNLSVERMLLVSGGMSFLFGCVSILPFFVVRLAGYTYQTEQVIAPSVPEFLLLVYIVTLIVVCLCSRKKRKAKRKFTVHYPETI